MRYLLALNGERLDDRLSDELSGVGLVRSEYICRSREEYITVPACRAYIAQYLDRVCELFYPNQVWYRTTEFVTPEVNVLRGCDFKIDEKHYLLGLRGVRRGLKYPAALQLELDNLAAVSQRHANLNVLFPYIKDPVELESCLQMLKSSGFKGRYGIMAEIPSTIFLIDDFAKLGISNITLGLNDLTTLILGTYRNSGYHDPTHPAVAAVIEQCVTSAQKWGIPVSVAGYLNKDLIPICRAAGVANLIVHYAELNKVLDVPLTALPDIDFVSEVKKLTKMRIRRQNHI